LADYARSLPSSSRSFLKASVKLVTDRLSNGIKSVATPQNVDAVQAALFRIESMQNAIETRQQKGTKAHTWFSKSQVKALLDTCGNDLRGQRDRLVLALLAGAGLRRAEAVSLTFADVKRQPRKGALRPPFFERVGQGRLRRPPATEVEQEEVRVRDSGWSVSHRHLFPVCGLHRVTRYQDPAGTYSCDWRYTPDTQEWIDCCVRCSNH
jgi:integrase